MWPRKNGFPKALLSEAAAHPNGYVYELDPRFDPDGAIPPWAVRRGWEVGPDGKPTGQFSDNPNYRRRSPLRDVDQIIADAKVHAGGPHVDILVADELTRAGRPVSVDTAMDMIVAELTVVGYVPAATERRTPVDGGSRYLFERHD